MINYQVGDIIKETWKEMKDIQNPTDYIGIIISIRYICDYPCYKVFWFNDECSGWAGGPVSNESADLKNYTRKINEI